PTRGQAAPVAPVARRNKRGISRFKQFTLLTHRQLELLRNDRVTLLLFLLQAPLMAILVIMLIRSSAGPGLFDQNKAVQCAPQIMQSVVAPSGTSGPVRLGIDTGTRGDPNAPVSCDEIQKLLSGDPKSKASAQMIQLAKDYTQAKGHGNVNVALQDFIVTGSGFSALTVLFIMAFLGVLPGCVNGVRQIVKERSIYRRERAINLGILPYVGAKMAFMGMFVIFQSTALLFIVHLFEPFRTSVLLPVLPEIFVTLVLTQLAGLMLGLAVSALAANEDSANGMLPFLLIPQVVFAGVEFQLKELPLQLIGMLDPMRWAVVALGTSAGLHSDKLGGDALLGKDAVFHGTLYSTFTQADAVHRLLLGWGALGTLIILLAIAACIGLKRKDVGRGAGRKTKKVAKARSSAHAG
ncbi:MAG TPA: ABC transporter permease, partial [Ktedonobacterales bacterium]